MINRRKLFDREALLIVITAIHLEEKSIVPFVRAFFNTIPSEKQAALHRIKQQKTRLQSVLGRALLAYQLKKELGIDYSQIHEVYHDFAKPSIAEIEGVCYNISHSGDWVVCAFGREEVGIDIEQIRPIKNHMPKLFLSTEEFIEWNNVKDHEDYLYELWVLKESYCKFTGKGLHLPMNTIRFYQDPNGILKVNADEQVRCKVYPIDKGYKMAVCSMEKLPEFVNIINVEEISRILAIKL